MTTYVTATEVKDSLEITGETYADNDIDDAVEAASRVIDAYKGTRFFPTAEVRTYTAPVLGGWNYSDLWMYDASLSIYDMCGLNSLTVDMDGDGVYEQTWVRDTDFYLEPNDADLTSKPWNQISLRRQGGKQWPQWQYAISLDGTFGWSTAPGQVTEAAGILANRYLKRVRETPYGMVMIGTDALAMARLGKIDPDVAFMLDNISDEDVPLLLL